MAPDDHDKMEGWDVGFDGHRRAQQLRLARMSFAEKLDWLEEAHKLVKHLARGPRSLPTGAGA